MPTAVNAMLHIKCYISVLLLAFDVGSSFSTTSATMGHLAHYHQVDVAVRPALASALGESPAAPDGAIGLQTGWPRISAT